MRDKRSLLVGISVIFLLNVIILFLLPENNKYVLNELKISAAPQKQESGGFFEVRVGTFNVWNFKNDWEERFHYLAELVFTFLFRTDNS
jgi:hypothetical protein